MQAPQDNNIPKAAIGHEIAYTDYKWTSFGLYQSPEQDKRNFDPDYENK